MGPVDTAVDGDTQLQCTSGRCIFWGHALAGPGNWRGRARQSSHRGLNYTSVSITVAPAVLI